MINKNKELREQDLYLAPTIEFFSTAVERGFEGTGNPLQYGDSNKPGASWEDNNELDEI